MTDYSIEPDAGDLPDRSEVDGKATAELDAEWADLLSYLLSARGFDFHGYKTNTLARRIRKRMLSLGLERFAAYQDYLEVHPDEFAILFNTILINVTSFFRDPEAWDVIRTVVMPELTVNKGLGDPVRVWCAGCATGEEAYSIAMLLAEHLGNDEYRDRVKIYATDVDEEALNVARHGMYSPSQVQGIPAPMLERYFDRADGAYIFKADRRRQVIFGRHDLIGDAPISRVDLLICRNTLMYFNAETQSRILARFHFALNPGGLLFLGRAETLMAHAFAFQPVDLKRRISRKTTQGRARERRTASEPPYVSQPVPPTQTHFAALEASPVAQVVVDATGVVILANESARGLFAIRDIDIGRPLKDLQLSYRPVELRSLLDRCEVERRQLAVKDVEWTTPSGETRWLDLHVAPLADLSGAVIGTAVAFIDVTAYRRLQGQLEESHHKLESAYDEVQASNEELQSTNEELETTNEELQSTVEELETTNEELQSTNEEMETMNEELQSTNEELHTMNYELRQRGDQLNSANAFLQSVLASMRAGVAVVDRELRVLAWNQRSEDLWGLRSEEALGQHLLGLDIGLPVDRLRPVLRACLGGDSSSPHVTLQAVNRRGKQFLCDVRVSPLHLMGADVRGAILLMEEASAEGD